MRARALLFLLIEDLIRWVSGPVGIRMRRFYYRQRLRRCGEGLVIEHGVSLINPDWIILGDRVWIDRNVTLIAGPPRVGCEIELRENSSQRIERGLIEIGSDAHLGIGSIIQGHGGVKIGEGFTMSPSAKIYSLSNDHRRCREGTVGGSKFAPLYILSPVFIGKNVWLGLNSVMIGHEIGDDVFTKPNSVIVSNITSNSVVEGFPARHTGPRFEQSSADQKTIYG